MYKDDDGSGNFSLRYLLPWMEKMRLDGNL